MTEIFIDILEGSNNTITVTENDNLTETYKLILMKNRIRINLTDKKVKFVFVKSNSKNGDIFDEMNISNPAEGEVELPITNKITKDNGLYSCGLAIYNNEGYLEHTGIFNLYVKENLFEKVSDELIEHNTYKKLTSLLDKASDINNKLITNTSEANKVNNAAINLKNALEGEVNKASQVNDILTKTNSAAVDKNTNLNNSLEEAKKLLIEVDKYNLDNFIKEIDNKDASTLDSAKTYTDENFLTKAPIRLDKKDLNTITDPGRYVCANCTNAPTTYGRMDVLVWNDYRSAKWITHIFYSDVSNKVFTRCSTKVDATTWTSWAIMYSSMNKPTPADIGASPSNHNHDDKYLGKTATATDSDKLFGYGKYTGQNQGGTFGIPVVGSDGVMETGYIIDMHLPTSSKDYDARLQLNGDGSRLAFNNHVIYTDGNKPSASDIGASPSNHNHDSVYLGRKGEINSSTDFNTITEAGMYKVQNITASTPNSPIKAIPNLYPFGILLVFKSNIENEDRVLHVYYPHQVGGSTRIPISRMKNNNDWTSWERVTNGLTASDVGARPSNWDPTWNDVQNKPSSFPPSGHNHDDLYFRKGNWNTNGGQDLLVHGKRALVGMEDGSLHLGYGGDFNNIFCGNGYKIYHTNNKPTPADIGAWSSSDVSQATQPYKVVQRDSAGDINARLLRSSYQDDNYINGAIAFRTNNNDDNYTRYCNSPTAVREWIGASPTTHNHDDRYLKKELGSTGESFRFITKFIEIVSDDTKIAELGVGPTDIYLHNTKSNKYLALKDDGRLVYNNKEVCDKGHFSANIGLNGYQMFPSGLLVQWGYVDMGKDTTKLVNFPKSFKDNNYNLQVSVYGGPGRVPAVKTYYAKNNNFYIQCEAGFCVYWEAKGSV
ncbi:BppU family phage baseplate upper protein [Clostridium baratii]|uniref:BppU family phage baseplate upper protein n=1 Tax=Clostridium baratii TaxID=1561 RepID=UPI0030CC1673